MDDTFLGEINQIIKKLSFTDINRKTFNFIIFFGQNFESGKWRVESYCFICER